MITDKFHRAAGIKAWLFALFARFRRTAPIVTPPPAPDKTAIKDALKSGRDVPGCRLTVAQRLEVR